MNKGGDFVQSKFKNKYRIASTRLKNHDYSSEGWYFITICTDDRKHYFGGIDETYCTGVVGKLGLARVETGLKPVSTDVAPRTHNDSCANPIDPIDPIKSIQSKICLSCWLDLPNHYPNCRLDAFVIMPDHVHLLLKLENNGIAETKKYSVSEIIRAFKTFTARRINEYQNTIGKPFWQTRFYDQIIRNEGELGRIREYIANNPSKWKNKRFKSKSIIA